MTKYVEVGKPDPVFPPPPSATPTFIGGSNSTGFNTWSPFTTSDYAAARGITTAQAQVAIDAAVAAGFLTIAVP
jgi:hypothetical protein